jgi:ABC-type microcin C transport system permease subunit YejB
MGCVSSKEGKRGKKSEQMAGIAEHRELNQTENENAASQNGNNNAASQNGNENAASQNGNENAASQNGNENAASQSGNVHPANKRIIRALWDYEARQKGDLTCKNGDVMELLDDT